MINIYSDFYDEFGFLLKLRLLYLVVQRFIPLLLFFYAYYCYFLFFEAFILWPEICLLVKLALYFDNSGYQ